MVLRVGVFCVNDSEKRKEMLTWRCLWHCNGQPIEGRFAVERTCHAAPVGSSGAATSFAYVSVSLLVSSFHFSAAQILAEYLKFPYQYCLVNHYVCVKPTTTEFASQLLCSRGSECGGSYIRYKWTTTTTTTSASTETNKWKGVSLTKNGRITSHDPMTIVSHGVGKSSPFRFSLTPCTKPRTWNLSRVWLALQGGWKTPGQIRKHYSAAPRPVRQRKPPARLHWRRERRHLRRRPKVSFWGAASREAYR